MISRLAQRWSWPRFTVVVAVLLAVYPVMVLVDFYSFVLATRMELGRWPVFNDPDPKLMAGHAQRIRITLGLVFVPVAVISAGMLSLTARWWFSCFPVWRILGLGVVCTAIFWCVARMDPGGYWNWFMD